MKQLKQFGKIRFFTSYFTEEKEHWIFRKEEFGYLPDGYYLIEEISDGNINTTIYSNESGEQIIIDQHLVSDNRQITMDLEYSEEKEVEVKGLPLLIYIYEDGFVSAHIMNTKNQCSFCQQIRFPMMKL